MSATLTPASPRRRLAVPFLTPAEAADRAMARRLAWLLWPGAIVARGFVSTELRVEHPAGVLRPDVSVVRGEPPADGVLDAAPALAVLLPGRPDDLADALLGAGSRIVWRLEEDAVVLQTPKRRLRRTGEEPCHVPRIPALRSTAGDVLRAAGLVQDDRPLDPIDCE
jgi:hypothetical protein